MPKANEKKLNTAAKKRCCCCDRRVHIRKIECGNLKLPSHIKCAQISIEAYARLCSEKKNGFAGSACVNKCRFLVFLTEAAFPLAWVKTYPG